MRSWLQSKRIRQTWALASVILCGGTIAFSAAAQTKPGHLVDRVVAVVKGEPILYSEVQEASAALTVELKKTGKDKEMGSIQDQERRVLDQLINERVIALEIKRLGMTVDEAQVDGGVQSVMQENGLKTLAELRQRLTVEGITMQEFREGIKKQMEQSSFMNRQVRPKVKIDAEDVDRVFEQKFGQAKGEEKTHVRMLFRKKPKATRAAMEALAKRIVSPETFVTVAKEQTQGPAKEEGGDIGWVSAPDLQPELSQALAKTATGAVSSVIETDQGFTLLQVVERKVEKPTASDAKKEEIRNQLFRDEMNRVFETLVRGLREKANIKTYL